MNLLTGDTTVLLADTGITRTFPKLSPNGQRVLFVQQERVAGAPYELRTAFINDLQSSTLLGANPVQGFRGIPDATWESDSRHVVAALQPGPDISLQLYELDASAVSSPNGVPRRLITTLTGTITPGLSLGPAAPAHGRPLIGPGAPFGDTASGIVFGQREGGGLASVVAFGGASSDSVELTAETGLNSNAPVLSMSLSADRLTSLAFANDPTGSVTQVIDSTSGATGALITFDATTGSVALILPFALTPGDQAPTVRDEGTSRVFRGHFLAVIGADGVRRPGPAAEVVFDHSSRMIRTR